MEFSDRLKSLRETKGVSQQDLANAIYVSRSAIAKWENGLGMPNKESQKSLCEYFKISIDELVSDNDFSSVKKNVTIYKKNILIIMLIVTIICLIIIGSIFFIKANKKNVDDFIYEEYAESITTFISQTYTSEIENSGGPIMKFDLSEAEFECSIYIGSFSSENKTTSVIVKSGEEVQWNICYVTNNAKIINEMEENDIDKAYMDLLIRIESKIVGYILIELNKLAGNRYRTDVVASYLFKDKASEYKEVTLEYAKNKIDHAKLDSLLKDRRYVGKSFNSEDVNKITINISNDEYIISDETTIKQFLNFFQDIILKKVNKIKVSTSAVSVEYDDDYTSFILERANSYQVVINYIDGEDKFYVNNNQILYEDENTDAYRSLSKDYDLLQIMKEIEVLKK